MNAPIAPVSDKAPRVLQITSRRITEKDMSLVSVASEDDLIEGLGELALVEAVSGLSNQKMAELREKGGRIVVIIEADPT